MIDETKLRPIVIKLASKLCAVHGSYRWKYLRESALDRIAQGADDRDEYVAAYHRFLRMARIAVKFMDEIR